MKMILVYRLERLSPTGHLFEDCGGGSGPNERFGIGIVVFEVTLDGGFELRDALEHAAADAIRGDQAEAALDLVEPGRRSWREVHLEPLVSREPGPDAGMFCVWRSCRRVRNASAVVSPKSCWAIMAIRIQTSLPLLVRLAVRLAPRNGWPPLLMGLRQIVATCPLLRTLTINSKTFRRAADGGARRAGLAWRIIASLADCGLTLQITPLPLPPRITSRRLRDYRTGGGPHCYRRLPTRIRGGSGCAFHVADRAAIGRWTQNIHSGEEPHPGFLGLGHRNAHTPFRRKRSIGIPLTSW